jgi:hypothetical protein
LKGARIEWAFLGVSGDQQGEWSKGSSNFAGEFDIANAISEHTPESCSVLIKVASPEKQSIVFVATLPCVDGTKMIAMIGCSADDGPRTECMVAGGKELSRFVSAVGHTTEIPQMPAKLLVRDATSTHPVGGANVSWQRVTSSGCQLGPWVTGVTTAEGIFAFHSEEFSEDGQYVLVKTSTESTSVNITVVRTPIRIGLGVDILLNPHVDQSERRIILNWNTKCDLDAHLVWASKARTKHFEHIYFKDSVSEDDSA